MTSAHRRAGIRLGMPCLIVATLLGALVALSGARPAEGDQQEPFDLATGRAPEQVVVPRAIPAIFESVSPTAGDAPLVLRVTTIITNAWFDAIAPYHPTAVGVASKLGRRPASEATQANKNIAILYASYRVLNSLLPEHRDDWRQMLIDAGLDPDDDRRDLSSPVGIGNRAGLAVVAAREHDGMNQLGDEGGRGFNRAPYADYLGYQPVNTAHELRDPSRWQPLVVSDGSGVFRVQQFVTPQMRATRPYSYDDPDRFRVAPPAASMLRGRDGRAAYRAQADDVLAASAALDDRQKMIAELFDNKISSLGFSALFASQSHAMSLDEFVHYDFLTNVAAFDTAIAVWNEKHRYDAVRPISAIRHIYGDRPVRAWGGPGRGTTDLPASQWTSYTQTADHPEYPSGSASFCAAHAQASRRFLGTDTLGWTVPVPQGSSRIEPGITPARDITLGWETWTDFARDCGLSRLWGGVHFRPAIDAGDQLGRRIGNVAHSFVRRHITPADNAEPTSTSSE
jgi:vanadium-dependent haloperoxidase-like protein/uncharacterized protein DUF6851